MAGVDLSTFGTPVTGKTGKTGNQAASLALPPDTGAKQTDLSQLGSNVTPTPPSSGWGIIPGSWIDAAKSVGTMAESAAADVVGLPRMLAGVINPTFEQSIKEQGLPSYYNMTKPGDVPLLPTAPETRQAIVNKTGLDYVPSTPTGRVIQKGGEAGLAALTAGPEAALPAFAGGSAQQILAELGAPEWLQTLVGVTAPVVAHTGVATTQLLREPNTLTGRKMAAAKVLDEAAVDPNAEIKPPQVQGARQTLGMATDDTGIRAFEKGRFNVAPNDAAFGEIKKSVNQATSNALDTVEKFPGYNDTVTQAENSSEAMHKQMSEGQQASRSNERAVWQQVDPARTLTTPIAPIETSIQNLQKNLEVARQGDFPNYVNDVIGKWKALGSDVSLNEVKALHTKVWNDWKAANNPISGDANAANVLYPVEQELRKAMDAMASTDPAQQAALDAARQASRDHHEIYDNKNVVQALNGPPSKAGNILNTREGIDAYHAAVQGSPEALDAARQYFMANLAKTATSNLDDNLSATRFNNYLRNNSRFVNDRRFFTADQADVIRNSGDQLNSLQKTPAAGMGGVSPTANLISEEKYAEALVGKGGVAAAKMLGYLKTAAATGAAHLFAGPLAGVGAFMASRMPGLGGIPYAAAAKGVMAMVDQALQHPEIATELRNFRNNPSTKTMTPRISNLLAPPTNPGYMPPSDMNMSIPMRPPAP